MTPRSRTRHERFHLGSAPLPPCAGHRIFFRSEPLLPSLAGNLCPCTAGRAKCEENFSSLKFMASTKSNRWVIIMGLRSNCCVRVREHENKTLFRSGKYRLRVLVCVRWSHVHFLWGVENIDFRFVLVLRCAPPSARPAFDLQTYTS